MMTLANHQDARTILDDLERFVSDKELSALTGFSRRTLQNWRHRGGGPPYVKVRRAIRYEIGTVLRWLRRNGRALERQ
jgi:hypothetical protein